MFRKEMLLEQGFVFMQLLETGMKLWVVRNSSEVRAKCLQKRSKLLTDECNLPYGLCGIIYGV